MFRDVSLISGFEAFKLANQRKKKRCINLKFPNLTRLDGRGGSVFIYEL